VFSYDRMCSLKQMPSAATCAVLLENVFSYYRMCSLKQMPSAATCAVGVWLG
jgi:hypothetical protein